jgi:hypothetical protein
VYVILGFAIARISLDHNWSFLQNKKAGYLLAYCADPAGSIKSKLHNSKATFVRGVNFFFGLNPCKQRLLQP